MTGESTMGMRANILVKLAEGVDREGVGQLVRDLEEIDEVTFAEPVAGAFDLIATIEGRSSSEEVVEKIKLLSGIAGVEVLKVNPIFPRERMRRNIAKLPHKAQN
jgi:hypothetical protein